MSRLWCYSTAISSQCISNIIFRLRLILPIFIILLILSSFFVNAFSTVTLHPKLKVLYGQPKKPWRRILYERQDYPDNFVDDTFLSLLITNANVQNPTFGSLVFDSLAITQEISIAGIFLSVFWTVLRRTFSADFLVALDVFLILFGSALKIALDSNFDARSINIGDGFGKLLDLFKFLGILLGLSPVLMTLTSAYSDDTIWALNLVLCTTHVFLHDYTFTPIRTTAFAGTISLNAAIFASILLASRLKVSGDVFAFVLFAFLVFAGFPFLSSSIRRYSSRLHLAVTLLLQGLVLILLSFISLAACVAMMCCFLFITLVCPFWLKWIKRYKNEIQGPWDYDAESEQIG
uniref:Phosphatidylinositol N-acetylglucosaminyltransferase subunit C n=1 Tax=Spongospora subterranea TaxID=70186 RepID=A0A0H5R2N1_9EUKA|eukprot:CRZ02149.1 hypothetical protein [Spongospora subterranea]